MKFLIAFLFAICGAQAWAAPPPCWPRQLGSTGSDFKRGATPEGQWLGWTCTAKGVTRVYGVVALTGYQIVHPPVVGMTPSKAAAATWAANVQASTPALKPLQNAMNAAFK